MIRIDKNQCIRVQRPMLTSPLQRKFPPIIEGFAGKRPAGHILVLRGRATFAAHGVGPDLPRTRWPHTDRKNE